MLRWFAVNTHARSEEKARFNLEHQGFEVYLPRYLKRRRHARRTDFTPAPLFPRYLFVGVDKDSPRWRAINSTFGVAHLVANGHDPLTVPEAIIQSIRAREDEEGWVSLDQGPSYRKGDVVQIKNGPLEDHVGLFDHADDSQRVFILLELLGRKVKVHMNAEQICAVT